MSVEEAVNVRVVTIDIDFAAADHVSFDVFHIAEEIEDVETIILEAEPVEVLEVYTESIRWFFVDEVGTPGVIIA
jgi:hypothetical protein